MLGDKAYFCSAGIVIPTVPTFLGASIVRLYICLPVSNSVSINSI